MSWRPSVTRKKRLIENGRMRAVLGKMQLKASHVLQARRVGRSAKKRSKILYGAALTCGSSCLRSCAGATGSWPRRSWGCSCLEWRSQTPHLKTGRPIALSVEIRVAAAIYRASGLVLWHQPDLQRCPLSSRYQGISGLCADRQKSTRLTHNGLWPPARETTWRTPCAPFREAQLSR